MRAGAIDVLYQPAAGSCSLPEAALAEMDAAGVALALVTQCKRWSCERQWMCVDTRLEDVTRFTKASNRFVGLAGYNPFDAVESLREMEAAHALGFRGAYLHAESFAVRLGDARLYPLYAKAVELGLAVVVQVALGEPALPLCMDRIGRDFPELLLAVVHPRPTMDLFEACGDFPGLSFIVDSSALAWMHRQGPDLLRPHIAERCMWGSNGAQLVDALRHTAALDLPAEVLESILRGNALRYFSSIATHPAPAALAVEVVAAER